MMKQTGLNELNPGDLSNRFYCLRHGRSEANEAGLIISDPDIGSRKWGLVAGAHASIEANMKASVLGVETLIYSSPFIRALETAETAAGTLGSSRPVVAEELRERWFGTWEGSCHDNYRKVWALDKKNPGNSKDGVESPFEVLDRLLKLIRRLDIRHKDKDIILVSHGDPIDILLTWAAERSLVTHMHIGMKTAEIRPLGGRGSSSNGT